MKAEFVGFPKLARLSREVIVTEKIDGTNAQIFIEISSPQVAALAVSEGALSYQENNTDGSALIMWVGSRSRWIGRTTDNAGFAKWAEENKDELFKLGQGRHFGEWWGSGIQRGYGLPKGEKRFSLFNCQRWVTANPVDKQELVPTCCHVVPILWRGMYEGSTLAVAHCLSHLSIMGSAAAPGFMYPEGIVLYHIAGNVGFKKTIEKDESPKSLI